MKDSIIIVIAAVLGVVIYLASPRKKTSLLPQADIELPIRVDADTPVNFGNKCMWIAVRTGDKQKVAEILGLQDITRANWQTGIEQAYDDKVFITPAVGQWTLVVGYGLNNFQAVGELEEINGYKEKINRLSKAFGEAHFFSTHHIVEYHLWAKSVQGKSVRVYAYLGERGENIVVEGEPTSIEKNVHLFNSFSPEAKDDVYLERADLTIPDEEFVMKIAASWSVDPNRL
jgi:hypothetical protein